MNNTFLTKKRGITLILLSILILNILVANALFDFVNPTPNNNGYISGRNYAYINFTTDLNVKDFRLISNHTGILQNLSLWDNQSLRLLYHFDNNLNDGSNYNNSYLCDNCPTYNDTIYKWGKSIRLVGNPNLGVSPTGFNFSAELPSLNLTTEFTACFWTYFNEDFTTNCGGIFGRYTDESGTINGWILAQIDNFPNKNFVFNFFNVSDDNFVYTNGG